MRIELQAFISRVDAGSHSVYLLKRSDALVRLQEDIFRPGCAGFGALG